MICNVLECVEPQESRGLCKQHLSRSFQGLVYENESGNLVDHCNNDHEMVGANVRWESVGRNGKRRRRCVTCLRERAQRQAANAIKVVEVPKPYRPDDETLTLAIDDFEEAKARVKGKCHGTPGPWMDWEDDDAPTRAEADKMCSGCPLRQACFNYAIAARETHGVWGGEVLIAGRWVGDVAPRVV